MREHTTSTTAATVTPCEAAAYTLHTIPGDELERLHVATVYDIRGSGRLPSDALADPAELFGAAYIEAAAMQAEPEAEALPLPLLWHRAVFEAARKAYRAERAAQSRPAGRDEDGRRQRAEHVRLDAMQPEAVGALLSDEYSDTPERVYIRRETVAEALAIACTDRNEAELVQMIAAGWTQREIAAALDVRPATVNARAAIIHARAQQARSDATAAAETLAQFGARARLAEAWRRLDSLSET